MYYKQKHIVFLYIGWCNKFNREVISKGGVETWSAYINRPDIVGKSVKKGQNIRFYFCRRPLQRFENQLVFISSYYYFFTKLSNK